MLFELIENGFGIEEGYNCSEKILYGANKAYNLGLSKDALVLSGGFGGGMAVESTCGALTGAVMAISSRLIEDTSRTSNARQVVELFLNTYEAKMGSIYCNELKEMHYNEEIKCTSIILQAAKTLDDIFHRLKK